MKVYLASSWNNAYVPVFKDILKHNGHEYYHFLESGLELDYNNIVTDFRDLPYKKQSTHVGHYMVQQALDVNIKAIEWCDVFAMFDPANKGSYIEFGYAKGIGKRTVIIATPRYELNVMDALADKIVFSCNELLNFIAR